MGHGSLSEPTAGIEVIPALFSIQSHFVESAQCLELIACEFCPQGVSLFWVNNITFAQGWNLIRCVSKDSYNSPTEIRSLPAVVLLQPRRRPNPPASFLNRFIKVHCTTFCETVTNIIPPLRLGNQFKMKEVRTEIRWDWRPSVGCVITSGCQESSRNPSALNLISVNHRYINFVWKSRFALPNKLNNFCQRGREWEGMGRSAPLVVRSAFYLFAAAVCTRPLSFTNCAREDLSRERETLKKREGKDRAFQPQMATST